jgi:CRP-like cAMP-binding protein
MFVLDNWYIFRKGDEADEMYFIKSGRVEICGDNGIVFVTLSTGAFFGEIALFDSCKRTASAKAKGNVELCTLRKDDFNLIMDAYPVVAEKIRQTIRERKENEQRVKDQKAAEEAAAAAAKKVEEERVQREKEEEEKKVLLNLRKGGRSMTREFFVGGKMQSSILSLTGGGAGRSSHPNTTSTNSMRLGLDFMSDELPTRASRD